jgi:hypothetical protein
LQREHDKAIQELYTLELARRVEAIGSRPISDLDSQHVVVELWQAIDRRLNIDTDQDQYDLTRE